MRAHAGAQPSRQLHIEKLGISQLSLILLSRLSSYPPVARRSAKLILKLPLKFSKASWSLNLSPHNFCSCTGAERGACKGRLCAAYAIEHSLSCTQMDQWRDVTLVELAGAIREVWFTKYYQFHSAEQVCIMQPRSHR